VWLFDANDAPEPILAKLISYDYHTGDEVPYETMLAIVMDRLLEDLPYEQEEAVRLLYLAGLSQHKAGDLIGVTHKTVKARAVKGLENLRVALQHSAWLADLLRGQIPQEEKTECPEAIAAATMGHLLGILAQASDEDE
jgi:hypothetical protein